MQKVTSKNKDLREAAYKAWPNVKKEEALRRYSERTVDNILHTGATGGRDPLAAFETHWF